MWSSSGIPSTKSAFLCAFTLQNPHFLAFRAQNRGFCVRMGDFSEILGRFDTKSAFLCAFCLRNPHFQAFRAQKWDFCALLPASFFPMALRHGAPASNKPHSAEKSTPVWLAIWHTWAGFANSQLRCAAFRCIYSYICTHPR